MNILQTVRQYIPGTGGMETYVANLCRQLGLHGHHADVATLDRMFKTGERLPPFEIIDGVNVIRFPATGNARYFFAPRLMEALPRYDLVHVHGVDFFIDMLGTLRRAHGKPLVLSTHGGFFHTRWLPGVKQAFFRTITRNSLKGVDRVIASSAADAEIFSRVTDRITLVENGIDYRLYSGVRRRPQGESLLFVGRLSKNKRIDRLLSAFSLVHRQRPGARLIIAGPDWEGLQEGLEQMARGLGLEDSVIFTGWIPQKELLEAIADARLFVSASEYEAFGLSTVEAMAAGLVPVVNRIPATEGLVNDGVDGCLCNFADSADTAAVIDAALAMDGDRYALMSEAARKTASRYDWEQVAGSIMEIYEEVLSGDGDQR